MQTTHNAISLIFVLFTFFSLFKNVLQNDAIHCDQVCACIYTHTHICKYVKCAESMEGSHQLLTISPSRVKEFLELVRKGCLGLTCSV